VGSLVGSWLRKMCALFQSGLADDWSVGATRFVGSLAILFQLSQSNSPDRSFEITKLESLFGEAGLDGH